MSIALKRARGALSPVRWLAAAVAALSLAAPAFAQAATVNVVAAENFYGDVASQIGGSHVAVTSILSNPDGIRTCSKRPEDRPRAPARTGRDLQRRQLRSVDEQAARRVEAGEARDDRRRRSGRQEGRRQPAPVVRPGDDAGRCARDRGRAGRADPANKAEYDANLQKFVASLKPVDDRSPRCARSTRACR